MLLAVLAITILLTLIGLYVSRDIFAPYVACPGVWSVSILILYFLPNNFYPVCHNFPPMLLLWVIGFTVSALMCERFTPAASAASIAREPNRGVLKAYMAITIVTMPIVAGLVLYKAFVTEPETMFRYMRIMNTGADENIERPNIGPLIYCTALAFVSLFFCLTYFKSKKLTITILLMNMLYALTTMSKTTFLSIIFSSLYICYAKKYVRIKHLLYGMGAFVALSFAMQSARAVGEDVEANSFLALYLSSSMVAFDYCAEPCSAPMWGGNTLRMFYAIAKSIGLTDRDPLEVILPFVYIPEMTNTYTHLYPFYIDFGAAGVAVFSVLYGLLYGFLYKKSRTGGKMELIIYAISLTFLLMEFIGDFVFTNLSQYLQYIFFAAIPFLVTSRQGNDKLPAIK